MREKPPLIARALRPILSAAQRRIKKTPALRALAYDNANRAAFSHLSYQEVMLADDRRLEFYAKGLASTVRAGDTVIDLGAGTGILSLLAAKQKPRKIYALEHSSIIEFARAAAEHNRADCIELLHVNSRDFSPPEPVDLVIHEQIGDYLFEENLLQNVMDLKRRALKPEGRIFPSRFELYLEPCEMRPEYRVPFAWEQPIEGIDYSFAREWKSSDGTSRGESVRTRVETGAARYLCNRNPILDFDLNEISDESEIPRSVGASKKVVTTGRIDAISVYFRVCHGAGSLDNALDSLHTSWEQWVFRIPSRLVEEGEQLEVSLHTEDLAQLSGWRVTVQ